VPLGLTRVTETFSDPVRQDGQISAIETDTNQALAG
jgi:hypothetical protein